MYNLRTAHFQRSMPTILVIDDDAQVRSVLRRGLEEAGYTVREAPTGREGVQAYRLAPTDLVILDILMPDQPGIETIMGLRRDHPSIKILAISGGGWTRNLSFMTVAEKLGARATLAKPFDIDALLEAVEKALGHQDPQPSST